MQESPVPAEIGKTEIIRQVRWRFRICNYLFKAAFLWIVLGYLGFALFREGDGIIFSVVLIAVGFGIFSAAFALTLAIYRCPVCDCYLSNFRPRKDQCGSCGAQIR